MNYQEHVHYVRNCLHLDVFSLLIYLNEILKWNIDVRRDFTTNLLTWCLLVNLKNGGWTGYWIRIWSYTCIIWKDIFGTGYISVRVETWGYYAKLLSSLWNSFSDIRFLSFNKLLYLSVEVNLSTPWSEGAKNLTCLCGRFSIFSFQGGPPQNDTKISIFSFFFPWKARTLITSLHEPALLKGATLGQDGYFSHCPDLYWTVVYQRGFVQKFQLH